MIEESFSDQIGGRGEEVNKKLEICDSELEKAEFRDDGKTKITELEEELRVVANNLKSLEVAEEEANRRERTYKAQMNIDRQTKASKS